MSKNPGVSLKEDQFKVFRTKVHALLERPKVRRSVIKALADAYDRKAKSRSRVRVVSANGKHRPAGRSDRWLDNQLSPSYAARARGPKAAASTITIAAAREIITALVRATPLTWADVHELFVGFPGSGPASAPALIVFKDQSKWFAAWQVDRLFEREPNLPRRWRGKIEASLTRSLMEYELFVPDQFPIAEILLVNAAREIHDSGKKITDPERRAQREIIRMAKERLKAWRPLMT